jgi:hypothetical protein
MHNEHGWRPGMLLVSRSFHNDLSDLKDDRERLLRKKKRV